MRYPVVSRTSIVECAIHGCSVALDEEGRIASGCPKCRKEAQRAIWRWKKRRQRSSTASPDLSPDERAEASDVA